MMKNLRLLLPDQLSFSISSLQQMTGSDRVLMCELLEDATRVQHHPKKIALWFAAMRHFSEELRAKNIQVQYVQLKNTANTQTLKGELSRALKESPFEKLIVTEPSEYHVKEALKQWAQQAGVILELRIDERFLCQVTEFQEWAKERKQLRMEYFYREMRRKYGILMDDHNQPIGGKWNYDAENRKAPPPGLQSLPRISHQKSPILKDILDMVEEKFGHHFGDLRPFHYAVTREQALIELNHFIKEILPKFGEYQDVMVQGEAYLYHSLLSSYLNIGLLLPLEICLKAQEAYHEGLAPLASVEGLIRQILGWREFIRGVYWLKMPEYAALNELNASRKLPDFYWGAKTQMNCISEAVLHTKVHAYSHHIQRLMVTGNFALLAGLDVAEVQEWYLSVYSDAYEWVEMPNTLGMALFGDGGIVASKPYAASGKYIHKMSNFCQNCAYDPEESVGPKACPFNALYWDFLIRHRGHFEKNQRIGFAYQTWDRFQPDRQQGLLNQATIHLQRMEKGEL